MTQLALILIAVYFISNIAVAVIVSLITAVVCACVSLKTAEDFFDVHTNAQTQETEPTDHAFNKDAAFCEKPAAVSDSGVVIHGYEPVVLPEDEGVFADESDELSKNVYTSKDEEFITNFIMLAKEREATDKLAECFERVGNDADSEVVNYLVTNLVRTFVKLVANIKTDKKDSIYKFENMLRLVRLDTVDAMKDAVCEIAIKLCGEVRQIRDDKEESISKRVQSYVEENFSDRELDVSKISDFLGLSPSYATRLFKQETGEVLSYYINRVRVDKARELLRLDLYRIEQIAHMVGYLDSRALSRAFKRFYGVTPSQYKEMSYIETNTGI